VVLLANDVVTLVLAFGVGAVAIAILLGGLVAMLEGDDRRHLLAVLRHPWRTLSGSGEDPGGG
jgi:hypothetical protein